MKRITAASLLFCAASTTAFAANQGSYVSAHYESRGHNHASGVAFTTYDHGMAFGISANKITSDKPLELQDRTSIYPVYGFANLALRTTLAPYVEFGVDLGDLISSEIANDSNNNSDTNQKYSYPIDAYGAIGLKTTMRRAPINFAFYVKSYALLFNGPDSDPTGKQRYAGTVITMSGANVIFNF